MASKGAGTGTVLLAAVLGIIIGAVGGFYVQYWNARDSAPSRPAGAESAPAMGGGGGAPRPGAAGGGPGGGGMAMGGPGGGQGPAMTLARTVRNLATVQRVQGQGLTAVQAKALLPILKTLRDAEKLPEKDAEARAAEVDKVLTPAQKEALTTLQPSRGPRGGGSPQAPRGPGGPASGPPTRPMAGSMVAAGGGGGGMFGGVDPERPFASDRNRAALDELIAILEKLGG